MPIKGYKCKLRVILAEYKLANPSFTLEEFAEAVGISRTTLYSLINEKGLPSFDVAYSIALALNRPIERIWVKFDDRVEVKEDDSV